MQFDRLALHSHILPALKAKADEGDGPWRGGKSNPFPSLLEQTQKAEVFDCRAIPSNFIEDAGEAAFHEAQATGVTVRLPYPLTYFEFDDESAVLAVETRHIRGHLSDHGGELFIKEPAELGETVETFPFIGWTIDGFLSDEAFGQFGNGIAMPEGLCLHDDAATYHDTGMEFEPPQPAPFFEVIGAFNPASEVAVENTAKLLLGVLMLLSDKLLSSETLPDPAPKLSKAREKRGQLPITGARHVLRVNVGALRAATRPIPVGSHESPCLHWRRGHWRVLHRGSEFESKAWVRKCLVGDPARGYAAKGYRLVKETPLIAARLQ
jgi:hypothetical protein